MGRDTANLEVLSTQSPYTLIKCAVSHQNLDSVYGWKVNRGRLVSSVERYRITRVKTIADASYQNVGTSELFVTRLRPVVIRNGVHNLDTSEPTR
jgi:hypothetical protein